ncbi:hypothetical protein C2W62_31275 [Candidatus Entotheonella serta]|nr:hypothetical protein C2W62_31275 [Candidatus Entotheonella serta]
MSKRFGVRGHLLLAFFGISAFAVLAATAAMYAFIEVDKVISRITHQCVPSALASLELSSQAERIVSAAPVLLTVSNREQHQQRAKTIAAEMAKLNHFLPDLKSSHLHLSALPAIEQAVERLSVNLDALNAVVTRKLSATERTKELLGKLWLTHTAFHRLVKPELQVMDGKVLQLRKRVKPTNSKVTGE